MGRNAVIQTVAVSWRGIRRPKTRKVTYSVQLRHDTPAMNDDAINIGINAALYHHMLWR